MVDHREIGQKLKLFMFHELSPGNPIWLPAGNTIYSILSDKIRKLNKDNGYVEVRTPIMWNTELYNTSGHWEHYHENMYLIDNLLINPEEDGPLYALKPMNCPGHMLIYKSQQFSYADLPYRIHDQGILHRKEVSGAIGGLTRCKSFCQDDGHVFLTESQLENEIRSIYDMIVRVYKVFDMSITPILSSKPNDSMGDNDLWVKAQNILMKVLDEVAGRENYIVDIGGGAFYGPKIDFRVKDSHNREFQTATIQLDFQLPLRFELKYTDADNTFKTPIVVHRAIFGSFERFIGILLEHYHGRLPIWLAPTQVIILPIAERHNEYAKQVHKAFIKAGLRARVNCDNLTLNKKILFAEEEYIPNIYIVGDKELATSSITLRKQNDKAQYVRLLADEIDFIKGEDVNF